jgi:hypothetical protein
MKWRNTRKYCARQKEPGCTLEWVEKGQSYCFYFLDNILSDKYYGFGWETQENLSLNVKNR